MLSRRRFLIDGLRVGALVPALSWSRAPRAAHAEERVLVLVVVQLSGGNDGLNMVVPHRQDGYFRSRPTLALKPASLHALDADHGFHPSMKELGALFAEGRTSVIQGVGYPGASRSHFRSMEIWHTADPDHPPGGVGWLGHMADQIAAAQPGAMPALLIGDEDLPLALRGTHGFAPTARDEHGLELHELEGLEHERDALLAAPADPSSDLAFLRDAARSAYVAAARLERAADAPARADYPDLGLARKLRLAAKLVAGGFDTRIFYVTLGSFDTHARQAPVQAALLEELSRSIAAFQRDLAASGADRRVLTLVFSEFGRRVAENASRGTDHGAAAPVLLVGGGWPGGMRGKAPDLERLEEGDVGFSSDFRGLYTALERDWMGLAPSTRVPAIDLAG